MKLEYLLLIISLILTTILIIKIFHLKLPNYIILSTLYFILVLLMLLFDSYLTALPIVEYNKSLVGGLYIGSIPLEDFGYLIVVVLLGPALFDKFISDEKRKK